MSGYAKRKIDLTIHLGTGDFGEGGFDTVTLQGLRVSAQITKSGMPGYNTADVRIYGMQLELMNRLSTLGTQSNILTRNNTISISPGDDGVQPSLAFIGTIQNAWTDFRGAPDVLFNILAQTGLIDKMKPVPPTSYAGAADVVTIMSGLAVAMGYAFENSGVAGIILSNPYFPGTAMEQAEACARAADIGFSPDKGTLAIWPKNAARKGVIPLISPATGMVGHPSYTGSGISVRSAYNPSVLFGGQIQVDSSIAPARGTWIVNQLAHDLESEMPGGAWFTDIGGYRLGNPTTIPG